MDKMINYFQKEFELSVLEKTKLKYSIKVLFNDISKILILFILFSIFCKGKELIYSVIALLTIRPFTGGLHFKSYMTCLFFTSSFFITSMVLSANVYTNFVIPVLFTFSMITILAFAPLINKNRPIYSYKRQLYFKSISLLIIIIHFVAYIIVNKNPYLRNSIWIFALQSIQLLIKKGVDIYEKRKSHYQNIT